MTPDDPKVHWRNVHAVKAPGVVSWFQPVPRCSLDLIRAAGVPATAPVIDVGGGAATLVDHLLAEGYQDLTVLDIAPEALTRTRERLGPAAARVHWIEADITAFTPSRRYQLWHDRAVFHFQVTAQRRSGYLRALRLGLQPGGHLVLATFGPEGPTRCSGLEVQRYSAADLSDVLGSDFQLVRSVLDEHTTPAGASQQFCYGWWRYLSGA